MSEKHSDNRKCCNCTHYDPDGYCSHMGSFLTGMVRVSPRGCCDHFEAPRSLSNSGYTEPGCFLTSACVDYYGKSDDCYELQTLRRMRDEHLIHMDGGESLIKQYYQIAPRIVEKIKSSEDCDECYKYIYGVILSCITLFENGNKDESVRLYKEMVAFLMKKFDMGGVL